MSTPTLPTPVALVGLGLSNLSVRRLLEHVGTLPENILVFTDKPADGHISDPDELARRGVRALVVSPGYPLSTPWIKSFRERGVIVTSEINLAAGFLEGEVVVAVTGSLGKSTTTSLLGEGLLAGGKPFFMGGNLGFPLADYVLAVLRGERPRAEFIALEVSSFQLECCERLPIDIGAITYFCSNHLERYDGLEHYYDTKRLVLDRARSAAFTNGASIELHDYLARHGLLASKKIREIRVGNGPFTRDELSRKALVGEHNSENIQLAASVLRELGVWDEQVREALLRFAGLAHRMERVGAGAGRPVFINDSKATALESVLTAVHSVLADPGFAEVPGRKLVCLFGGRDKKHPWEKLRALAAEASRLDVVFFGECGEAARARSGLDARCAPTLRSAMHELRGSLPNDAWVLLSPGGTSLDEFKNFEDRGRKFAQWAGEFT